MIEHDLRAVRYLRGVLSEDWGRAAEAAGELADRIRYLPWADRARALDGFLWGQALGRLTKEDVTAIVNRQMPNLAEPERAESYALFCRAVVTTTLDLLEDAATAVEHEASALVHSFSLRERHRDLALDWIGDGHNHQLLAEGLPAWPSCAFLLLILSPSDSAESFLARDAFWAAMLGRC